MGIPQVEITNRVEMFVPNAKLSKTPLQDSGGSEEAPKIPPRMKKKGPELPEKPPHLRVNNNNLVPATPITATSSQNHIGKVEDNRKVADFKYLPSSNQQRNQLPSNLSKSLGAGREILIAATKGVRDRPAEKRQREPAKLLTPTFNPPDIEDINKNNMPVVLRVTTQKPQQKSNSKIVNAFKIEPSKANHNAMNLRKSRTPVILIPRTHLDPRSLSQLWSSYHPMSYAMWVQKSGSGDPQITSGLVRKVLGNHGSSSVELRNQGYIAPSKVPPKPKIVQSDVKVSLFGKNTKPASSGASGTSAKPRSSSVTRSGSLTSHGSTSSDSGNETFPKSVLKKHKRNNTTGKKNATRPEQKKNVTFNAFATVQLMEE